MIKPDSWIIFLSVFVVGSCAAQKPIYNETVRNWQDNKPKASSDLMYEVFLIGDSRRAYEDSSLMEMMESHLSGAGENSAVVFLGDNVQPNGLPDSTHRQWEVAQKSLDAQLILLEDFKGRSFFSPGIMTGQAVAGTDLITLRTNGNILKIAWTGKMFSYQKRAVRDP
jgi:hypothetical protein